MIREIIMYGYSCIGISYSVGVLMIATALLGGTVALLGAFVLLRNQGMMGDAISHGALPGTVLTLLLFGTKNPLILGVGGMLSALLGMMLIECMVRGAQLKQDTAVGIILSVFFGSGLVLITIAQKISIHGQGLLHRLLLGNAALMTADDVCSIALVSLLFLCVMVVFWKELCWVMGDYEHARTLGYPAWMMIMLLTGMTVMIIALGLQLVGGILMSTLLLAPAAAARQWTNTLKTFVMLSVVFGVCAATAGSLLSVYIEHMPTGPTIVLCAGIIMLSSLMVGRRIS